MDGGSTRNAGEGAVHRERGQRAGRQYCVRVLAGNKLRTRTAVLWISCLLARAPLPLHTHDDAPR